MKGALRKGESCGNYKQAPPITYHRTTKNYSPLGDRIKYLLSPVGACAEATDAPSR
jgi:hypothetical protein